MKLYLYDFDGTISNRDSMFTFICFIKNKYKIAISIVLNFTNFFKFFLGIISKSKLKEKLLIELFKEFGKDELKSLSISFSRYFIKNFLKESAIESIQNAKENKYDVCIVSASLDIWMKDIADQLGLSLICTDSFFINKTFAGFKYTNCIGRVKVERIRLKYDLNKYDEIFCFGDSKGDFEMLNIGTKSFYKSFK